MRVRPSASVGRVDELGVMSLLLFRVEEIMEIAVEAFDRQKTSSLSSSRGRMQQNERAMKVQSAMRLRESLHEPYSDEGIVSHNEISGRPLLLKPVDRLDLPVIVKELARYMSTPTKRSFSIFVKVARCLRRRPHLVLSFSWQAPDEILFLAQTVITCGASVRKHSPVAAA